MKQDSGGNKKSATITAMGLMLGFILWLEPQFTILHDGTGQPKMQLFAGLNLQFPKS
jgi:hypothetical protein